jgi:hypothetical protein
MDLYIISRINKSVRVLTVMFNTDAPQFMATRIFDRDTVDKPRIWLMQCSPVRVMLCLARFILFSSVML